VPDVRTTTLGIILETVPREVNVGRVLPEDTLSFSSGLGPTEIDVSDRTPTSLAEGREQSPIVAGVPKPRGIIVGTGLEVVEWLQSVRLQS